MNADDVTAVVAGLNGAAPADASDSLAALLKQFAPSGGDTAAARELATAISDLKTASELQAEAVTANTDAVAQNTSAKETGSASALVTAAGSAGTILSSGFGLAPLFAGLFHLFGGGGSEPDQMVYPKTTRPASIGFESLYSPVDETDAVSSSERVPMRASEAVTAGGAAGQRQAPAQITIQVQALDSRSFLDHRDEIARAVRSAMLNSNSLNDVVSDL